MMSENYFPKLATRLNLPAHFRPVTPKNERGVVLIVALIMVLLMTIIGLASIEGSDLQERMAGNVRDRNVAFQSAEAGLRSGELELTKVVLPLFDGSKSGYWPDLQQIGAIRPAPSAWTKANWAAYAAASGLNLEDVFAQPMFAIERVITPISAANEGSGADVISRQKLEEAEFFRVTSRAVGGSENTEVVLQSTYKR